MPDQKQFRLWELAGEDDKRVFSPYAWRVRLVLAHKGIQYQSVSWRYSEKQLIQPFDKVPVLDVSPERRLNESWNISQFLEENYPDPSLFKTSCQAGATGLEFITHWADNNLYLAVAKVICMDLYNHLAPQDKKYFRESREAKFGQKLEEVCQDTPAKIAAFREECGPLRQVLRSHSWLGGSAIGYADIAVASMFLWARAISGKHLLEKDDPIYAWRERMFNHFADTIKDSVGYPV